MNKLISVVIILLTCQLSLAQGLVPDAQEKQALIDFYNSTNGAGWVTKWNIALINNYPAISFVGVTITNGDVTAINLPDDNLVRGTLPTTIGNLTQLTGLTIRGSVPASVLRNIINGAIPTSISSLSHLTSLFLTKNECVGSLPAEIGSLTSLKYLDLSSSSGLTGPMPASWANLTQLVKLVLDGVSLSVATMPTGIQNWDLLKRLSMHGCALTEASFPLTFGGMAVLDTLDLSANPISNQPPGISDLLAMESLDLSNTFITSLLPSFSNLDNLKSLTLSGNSLTKASLSQMFPILSGCAQLTNLDLTSNQITGIPPSYSGMISLRVLLLDGNPTLDYNDLVPLVQGPGPALKDLRMSVCNLNGFPSNLASLISLENLDVSGNNLGVFPPGLITLINLKTLQAHGSHMSGPVPSGISNLALLQQLDLSFNTLSSLPSLANLINLNLLSLSHNQFSGPLIGNFAKLGILDLSFNQFISPLPDLTGSPLVFLFLNNNNFNQDLPQYLNIPSISQFNISNNHFTGIPNFTYFNSQINRSINTNNNDLDFGDLEPNFNGVNNLTFTGALTYSPQSLVGSPTTFRFVAGINFTIPFTTNGTHNKYKWQKFVSGNWIDITTISTSPALAFTTMSAADAGDYRVIITNDWATQLTLTSQTITLLLVTPMCESPVPNLSGQFKMDKLSGAIVFQRNDCDYSLPLLCVAGPAQGLSKVVSASATVFDEKWTYDQYKDNFSSLNPSGANDIELARRGKMRVKSSYSYNGSLVPYDRNFNSGTFPYSAFSWRAFNGSAPRQWLLSSKVELYSLHGQGLQESNALNIKSAVKFGYRDAVPYLTAKNAEYGLVFFESFESNYAGSGYLFEDGYVPSQGVQDNVLAHSGRSSLNLSSGGDLELRPFDFVSTSRIRPLYFKVWVHVTNQAKVAQLGSNLSIKLKNSAQAPVNMKMVARVGDWALCEATLTSFGGQTVFTPIISYALPEPIWLDDLRVQPADSEMSTYVYDAKNLRLLTIFDDQHFGLYFLYNSEGKLMRKMIETTRGLKTIQESQYNAPTVLK